MKKAKALPAANPGPALLFDPAAPAALPSTQSLLDTFAPIQAPSAAESFVRGAAQPLTLGFADEIAGGIDALRGAFAGDKRTLGEMYREGRDESRANYKAAEEANPLASMAGTVGGSLASILLPVGGVAGAATAGGRIAGAAALGGVAGLGSSEADVTKGELGNAARDTATGAALGAGGAAAFETLAGALRGGAKIVKDKVMPNVEASAKSYAKAQLREAAEAGGDALAEAEVKFGPVLAAEGEAKGAQLSTDRARKAAQEAMKDEAVHQLELGTPGISKIRQYGKEGVRKEPVIQAIGEDQPLRLALLSTKPEATKRALDVARNGGVKQWGEELGSIYKEAGEATEGARVFDINKKLTELAEEYGQASATQPQSKALMQEAKLFYKLHGGEKDSRVGIDRLHKEVQKWQEVASEVNGRGERNTRAKIANDIANILRESMHEEIERAGGPELIQRLRTANQKFSAYKAIEELLSEKHTKEMGFAPPMGELLSPLKHIRAAVENRAAGEGANVIQNIRIKLGAKAAAKAEAEGAAEAGAAASASAGTPGGAGGSAAGALARLVAAVRKGAPGGSLGRLAEEAIAAGAPRATVSRVIEAFGGSTGD